MTIGIRFVENGVFLQKSVDKRKQVWYYKQAVARKQISTECKKKIFKEI